MQPTEQSQTVMGDRVTDSYRKVGTASAEIHKTKAGSCQLSSSSLGAFLGGVWERGFGEIAAPKYAIGPSAPQTPV